MSTVDHNLSSISSGRRLSSVYPVTSAVGLYSTGSVHMCMCLVVEYLLLVFY